MRPRSWKTCLLLLALSALGSTDGIPAAGPAEDGPFRVQEVRLTVEEKTRPFDFLLAERIEQIVPARGFVAFRSGRTLWIKLAGRPVRTLDQLADLPSGFDWYENACAAGDRLVVAVSRYPEEQRLREERSGPGEFREGPRPAGYLVIDLRSPRVTLLERFRVTSRPPLPRELESVPLEELGLASHVTLGMQSCAWDGRSLFVGDSGTLARIDLAAGTADLLEEDLLGVNRPALLKDGDELWYAASMDAPWMGKWTPDGGQSFSLLNQEGLETDSLLKHRGRLLASSPRGVVEIDEQRRTYVRYRLSDEAGQAVHGLTLQQQHLLGARHDGWVELDLSRRRATRYRLTGPGADNRVLSIGFFDGDWYLGTASGLVRVG